MAAFNFRMAALTAVVMVDVCAASISSSCAIWRLSDRNSTAILLAMSSSLSHSGDCPAAALGSGFLERGGGLLGPGTHRVSGAPGGNVDSQLRKAGDFSARRVDSSGSGSMLCRCCEVDRMGTAKDVGGPRVLEVDVSNVICSNMVTKLKGQLKC